MVSHRKGNDDQRKILLHISLGLTMEIIFTERNVDGKALTVQKV